MIKEFYKMEIKIINNEIKDVWDLQKAQYLLKMEGLSGNILNRDLSNKYTEKITLYLWEQINKQFPQIKDFCNGKTGGFNKCSDDKYKTPIINIHGDFYLQLISLNDRSDWVWEGISLKPYRFNFNEEGYFKGLVVDGINKAIMSGEATKETFKKLINSLNENPHKESILTIQTRWEDLGKVELNKVDTKII